MRKILVVGLALAALMANADEKIFTGAVDRYWSKPGNWQGGVVPVSGDSVVLASTTQSHVVNDIQGLTLVNFTFSGYGEDGSGNKGAASSQYQAYLEGNGFTLAAGGNLTLTSKVRLNHCLNVALAEGPHEMSTVSGARWDITGGGTLSGAGSLTLTSGLYIPYNNTTFAGDFTAKSGTDVYAFVNKPFGEGTVLFENGARLTMYRTGIDIANDIEFRGEASNAGNIIINNSGAFSGTVTFYGQQRFKAGSSATPLILTFRGPVKSTSDNLLVTNLGVADFRHEIVFEDVANLGGRTLWMDGPGSTIRFKKAGNTFGSSRLSGGQIFFEMPGACCPTAELGMMGTAGSRIVVEGDQVAKRLYCVSVQSDMNFSVTSQRGGRLILKDTQSDSFPGAITGPLDLVWAPTGNLTYTVNGVCSFSGALVVSNGTFAVGSATASPTNVTSIVLAHAASLQVPSGACVNTRLDTLSITATSTLSLPEQTNFTVDHFLVDGVEQPENVTYTGGTAAEGQVHLDALPANVTVYTRIQPGLGARTEWNGLGGASDRTDLAVNWAAGTVPALHEKTLVAVTGGSSASLAADTTVNGISFETGPFTVKGASALDLYWGGLSILNPATTREAYTFNVSLRICGEQTWFVPSLDNSRSGRLQMNEPITDGDDRPYTIYKTGGGFLFLNATNTFTGDLVISNGQVVVQKSESVGAAHRGKVLISHASGSSPHLWLCPNTRISRPVELSGPDAYLVRSDSSGICELAGPVTIADTNVKRFQANGTSTMLFSGGVVGKGMFYVQGTGYYVITNKPIDTTGMLYSDVKADITLAVSSNSFNSAWMANTNTILRIRADDAIRDNRQISVRKSSTIDLGRHVLSIGNFCGEGRADVRDCFVTGGAGCELRVNASAGYGVHAVFRDGASLRYRGNGYNMTLHGVSSTTGTVSCANSCLVFAEDAGWTGGVVAVTNGNAAILVHVGTQFGRNTDVVLGNGGRLSIGAGAELTCRYLYLDGVRQPNGTYGAAASSAGVRTDVYFWPDNTGILRVLGDQSGTMLMLR